MVRSIRALVGLIAILVFPYAVCPQQPRPLTNKDVSELLNAGLSSEVVIAKIKSSPCSFETSPEQLKELKAANVPDGVILAMVQCSSSPAPPPSSEEPAIRILHAKCGENGSEVDLLPSPGSLPPVAVLKCGEVVSMLSAAGSWYRVRTESGAVGYISQWFVSEADPGHTAGGSGGSYSRGDSVPPGEMRAIAWRAVPWVTTTYYQQPGNATTDCTGSGSWVGTVWRGSASCTSQYTPAQSVPINWTHYTIYNLVETSNDRLVIACTRNWAFSKCSYLIPGNVFYFENSRGKISVTGRRSGKSKDQSLDFDIVSTEPRA